MAGPIEKILKAFVRYGVFVLALALIGMGVYGLIDFDRPQATMGDPLWIISIVVGIIGVRIARPIDLFWTTEDFQPRPLHAQTARQKTLMRVIKILIGVLLVSMVLWLISSRLSTGEGSLGLLLFDIFGMLTLAVLVTLAVLWFFFVDHKDN